MTMTRAERTELGALIRKREKLMPNTPQETTMADERIELPGGWSLRKCCSKGWVFNDPTGEPSDHLPDGIAAATNATPTPSTTAVETVRERLKLFISRIPVSLAHNYEPYLSDDCIDEALDEMNADPLLAPLLAGSGAVPQAAAQGVPVELKTLSEAATPGPWFHRQSGETRPSDCREKYDWIGDSPHHRQHKKVIATRASFYGGTDDYAFVVAAANFVRSLLSDPSAAEAKTTKATTMYYPVILNGDHAEFEAEWAGKDPKTRPDWPLPSFDAQDWAAAFMEVWRDQKMKEPDEAWMISWFANALMRGFDEHGRRVAAEAKPPEAMGGRSYMMKTLV